MGLCPFHNEKSPSFTVSPTKQFYHCFGCGAHGTAIGFLMEHIGAHVPGGRQGTGAIGRLDRAAGTVAGIGGGGPAKATRRRASKAVSVALTEVMQTACDFYRKQLRGAPNAIAYLKKRGLTGEIAARFGLGYAPDGWQNLEAAFPDYRRRQRWSKSGLVIVSEKSDDQGQTRRYDRFRERVMFPIRNVKGQVIGFGGRVLDGGEPKYLNSPGNAAI